MSVYVSAVTATDGLAGRSGAGKLPLMPDKTMLRPWILEALEQLGGEGSVVDVCRVVWQRHEHELRAQGDLFFTWQYDIRWAAQQLRDEGRLQRATGSRRRDPWQLS